MKNRSIIIASIFLLNLNLPTLSIAQWTQVGGPTFSSILSFAFDVNGNVLAGADDRILELPRSGIAWTPIVRLKATRIIWRDQQSFFFAKNDGIFLYTVNDSSVRTLATSNFGVSCFIMGRDSSLYIGGGEGLLVSRDRGQSWTRVIDGFAQVESIAVDTSGVMVAAVNVLPFPGRGLYRSNDNGKTWTRFAFPEVYVRPVWISSMNVYFYKGYRSTDNGATWAQMSFGPFNNMAFASGDTAYGSSGNDLYQSIDSGLNWSLVESAGSQITSLEISKAGVLYVGSVSSGVYVLSPGDRALRAITARGLAKGYIYSLMVSRKNTVLCGAREPYGDGGIYISEDNGQNWGWVLSAPFEPRAFAVASDHTIYTGGNEGTYRSLNDGRDWSSLTWFFTNTFLWSLAIDKSENVFAGLVNYGVAISSDKGDTWTHSIVKVLTYMGWSLAAAPDGGMYVGTQGGIFYSSDLGQHWTDLGLPGADANTILVKSDGTIFLGTKAGDIWRSTNKGANWINVIGQTFKGVPNCSAVNSKGVVFIGTNGNGVFRSSDNGNTWAAFSDGLTQKIINALAIDSAGYVFAGTLSDGVFRTLQSTTPVERENVLPRSFALFQNYPNPFNPSTAISFQLPSVGLVTLKVFNTLGEEVATLVNEVRSARTYKVQWNASSLPSGVYFYRLQVGGFVETRKMILIK